MTESTPLQWGALGLWAGVLLLLAWQGRWGAVGLVTSGFLLAMSAWRLWNHYRGNQRARFPTLEWGICAISLAALLVDAPWF